MATPRLKDKYVKEIVPALKQRFSYKSIMQVPKIEKICINKGMGVAVTDKKNWLTLHWKKSARSPDKNQFPLNPKKQSLTLS
jgi:hypothetical protein